MIPYDALVAALSSWRARQGLPVSTLGGTGSGPTAKAGSGPNRAPPSPPPGASRPGMAAAQEEEVSAEMLDEGAYENEGNDFAMNFNGERNDGEATSIGGAPERPTEAELGNNREDW